MLSLPTGCHTDQTGLFRLFWPQSLSIRLSTAGAWRASLCALQGQPETGGRSLSWPAGPAGRCCRAEGHMLAAPCDPGQPSGLGCAVTGGSRCPRDPSLQPVGRERPEAKSKPELGPELSYFPSWELLALKNVSWKQEPQVSKQTSRPLRSPRPHTGM